MADEKPVHLAKATLQLQCFIRNSDGCEQATVTESKMTNLSDTIRKTVDVSEWHLFESIMTNRSDLMRNGNGL